MSDPIIFTSHSEKQDRAIFSDYKITALITGIQFGKTSSGSMWMKRLMHRHADPKANFLITAPTYKIMEQSTLPAFLSAMEGYGEYNQSKAIFRMHRAGTCYMRTGTEPDSVVGITNVYGVWGDEAGKYSLYFWENIQGRASFKNCPILLTTSPYTLNWIYRDLIKPTVLGKRKDVNLIQASSIENPYFPKEEYERRRATMDPRRFAAMYGGHFERMSGLVYDCFDEDQCQVEPFALPTGTKYIAGVDWGYTDPFVLKVRAITPDGKHYGVSEFYKTGMTLSDMIEIAKEKKAIFGIQTFWCDPSQPGCIEEFKRNALSAQPAINDIRRGVDLHYELIKTRRLKYFRGHNPYTLDELDMYHYPEPQDLGPDDHSKEQLPVGQNDHCLDVDRYITIMTYRSHLKRTPVVPGDIFKAKNHSERIEQLKKRSRHRDERWSD